MFVVAYQDHLDHDYVMDRFDNYEDAKKHLDWCVQQPVEAHDYSYEIIDDTEGNYETIEFVVVQEEPQD